MTDMPKNIWVYRDLKEHLGVCFAISYEPYNQEQKKRYTDADISEARIAKLEDALDAAYRALKGAEAMDNTLNNGLLNFTLDNVNWYNSAIVTSNIKKALYEIKQAKGEA